MSAWTDQLIIREARRCFVMKLLLIVIARHTFNIFTKFNDNGIFLPGISCGSR